MTYNGGVKGYRQYCPVAHALDQVGDRWELLIVRELMLGQRRYTDLAEALPGIGSNVLTQRLRELEASGIVRKTKLPPPFAVSVYELTDHGRELDDVLRSLARFGARTLGPPEVGDCWSMYAVHTRFRPEHAVDGTYEVRFVGGETISLQVRNGELDPAQAIADGRVTLHAGSEKELSALAAMFAPFSDPLPVGAAASAAAA